LPKINESIVLVGGGGGVYRVAKFLKHIRPNITTVQTVFDHGGHSGELRDERGVLPPGDIRQAIVALSDDNAEPALRRLMGYRFGEIGNSSLDRATVGNILLTALAEIEGSLPLAINALCRLCGVRGKVLPVSLDDAELCAELSDGTIVKGEGNIDTRSIDDERSIARVFLDRTAHIFVGAYDALVGADKIVFCPGDIYTSLIPNLLVNGFVDAVKLSSAKLIYCVNIMTKKAETHGFTVTDFSRVVCEHLDGRKPDFTVFNIDPIDHKVAEVYAKEKSEPVILDYPDGACEFAHKYISEHLVDCNRDFIRHHPRIASVIADL